MSHNYEKTSYFWNDIFENKDVYNPKEPLPCEALEKALDWVAEGGGTLMDFGSGNGHMLLRCLEKGAIKTIGVDLSFHAISLARRTSSNHYETLRTKWIWGDVKSLFQLPDACVSGLILSDVIESMLPDDALKLIHQSIRLLDHNGRILIKANPYLNQEALSSLNLKPLYSDEGSLLEDAYEDKNGLFLINMTDAALQALFEDHFDLVERRVITESPGLESRLFLYQLKG